MKWKGGRKSTNVEDRRATSGGGGGNMPSMGTMILLWPIVKPLLRSKFGMLIVGVGAAAYFMGYNPLTLIGMGGTAGKTTVANEAKDNQMSDFMKTTLGYTEEVWNDVLPKYGMRYKEPVMVLYRGGYKKWLWFCLFCYGTFLLSRRSESIFGSKLF